VTWIKLDDDFYLHPKVQACEPTDVYLWVVATAWSAARSTDGAIPAHMVPVIGALARCPSPEQAFERLHAAGLVDLNGPDEAPGWTIHDFLNHQQSKAQRDEAKAKDRDRKATARAAREAKAAAASEGVRAESERNPSGVRSREGEGEGDRENTPPTPPNPDSRSERSRGGGDVRTRRVVSLIAWHTAKATPNVRSVGGLQAKIVAGADDDGLTEQVAKLIAQHPDADDDWLVAAHLRLPLPRAPRPEQTEAEIRAAARAAMAANRAAINERSAQ